MKRLLLLLLAANLQAARLYVVNKGIFVVTITRLETDQTNSDTPRSVSTEFKVQPGQSTPVHVVFEGNKVDSFSKATVQFNADGYTKQETLYFPADATEQTSLVFSESGYKRYPYNVTSKAL